MPLLWSHVHPVAAKTHLHPPHLLRQTISHHPVCHDEQECYFVVCNQLAHAVVLHPNVLCELMMYEALDQPETRNVVGADQESLL